MSSTPLLIARIKAMDLPSGEKAGPVSPIMPDVRICDLDLMPGRGLDQNDVEWFLRRFLSAATRYLPSGDQSRFCPTASIRVGKQR